MSCDVDLRRCRSARIMACKIALDPRWFLQDRAVFEANSM